MENESKNKWRAIAVCEAILICVAVIVAVLMFVKNNGKTQLESDEAVGNQKVIQETQPLVPVDNVVKNTDNKDNTEENNSTADDRTEAQTENSETKEEQTEAKEPERVMTNAGDIKVSFREDKTWESGDAQFAQYSMILENTSDTPATWWKYTWDIPEDVQFSSAWGCTTSVEGKVLVIEPVSYTAVVEKGAAGNEIGIIIQWKKGTQIDITNGAFSYDVEDGGETQPAETISGEEKTEASKSTQASKSTDMLQESGTPVAVHGRLGVSGTDLVDESGKPYQLKGVSTHGIAWYPQYITEDTFKTLRDDYNVNTIRIAMYTSESGGYCSGGNKSELKGLVDNAVSYTDKLGMYVIIDWHILSDGNPKTYMEEAKKFFDEVSKKYSGNKNVIYEICNEPNGSVSWSDVKSYAEEVIKVIRKNDKNAVIIVGTPTWSQDVDTAAGDRISNDKNVMYALHFYAATHTDGLRSKLKSAHEAGLPVFISEFSICDASGNGSIDYNSAKEWLSLINSYNISYVGWSLSNKSETSALLKSSCNKVSGFTKEDLSDTGKWLFESFK